VFTVATCKEANVVVNLFPFFGRKIFVGGIAWETTEGMLHLYSQFNVKFVEK
jgi:hypothetical protein